MAKEFLGTGNDDGTVFGRSDEKIGFYGLATAIVKPAFTYAAVTVAAIAYSTVWALTNSSQITDVVNLVNDIRAQMVALGLVTT